MNGKWPIGYGVGYMNFVLVAGQRADCSELQRWLGARPGALVGCARVLLGLPRGPEHVARSPVCLTQGGVRSVAVHSGAGGWYDTRHTAAVLSPPVFCQVILWWAAKPTCEMMPGSSIHFSPGAIMLRALTF